MIDKEFVTFTQESGDRYGEIAALNALAVDCSANHSYGDAYTNGKNALDVALNVIYEIAEETGNDSVKELHDFYYNICGSLKVFKSLLRIRKIIGYNKNYSGLLNEIRSRKRPGGRKSQGSLGDHAENKRKYPMVSD